MSNYFIRSISLYEETYNYLKRIIQEYQYNLKYIYLYKYLNI
jgi:hypothetical protein